MGVKRRLPISSIETNYMKQQEVSMKRAARRKKLLIRRLSIFLILTVALSYLLISNLIHGSSMLEAKQEEKVKLEETLAKLEKRQQILENEIIKLNDDEYIGKFARSEYFLSDIGEVIFNIPDPKKKDEEEEVPY